MTRMRMLAALATAAVMALAGGCAHAVGTGVDVRITDRATGESLPLYWHDGNWWVPGVPGRRYAVALTNRNAGRVLTVISVDGVNVVSGETASAQQTGYVLDSGQSTQITGWRKDMTRVAAFEFTALPNSYAARTGRPEHVGVIGVAVFRERERPQVMPPSVSKESRSSSEPSAAPPAPAAGAASDARGSVMAQRSERAQESRIGTGHGRSETSVTRMTDFERASATPVEVITIRYDSRDNLVAMGVIPTGRPAPDPFPASAGFVPDPPRR